jgi:Tfp pilus assembly protein PilN
VRELEFLPEWYPKVRLRRRRVALQGWLTLLLLAALGSWMLFVQRNVRAEQRELSGLSSEFTQSEAEVERLDELLKLQRQLGQQDEIFLKIGRPIEATKLFTTLEELMPPAMALLDLDIDTEDAAQAPANTLASRAAKEKTQRKLRFRLHGVAPTDVEVGDFLARLSGRPLFSDLELSYSHERTDSGRVMREFEITFAIDLSGLGGRP